MCKASVGLNHSLVLTTCGKASRSPFLGSLRARSALLVLCEVYGWGSNAHGQVGAQAHAVCN
eukprot:2354310-Amphidinium_carterae.1